MRIVSRVSEKGNPFTNVEGWETAVIAAQRSSIYVGRFCWKLRASRDPTAVVDSRVAKNKSM